MPTPEEIETRFWSALKSDRTIMLGIAGTEGGHTRPMTGLVDGDQGPIYVFTSKDNGIVEKLASNSGAEAVAAFVSKGHDVFATIDGTLSIDNDPAVIDRLWNPYVAAWYEGGKTDPKLVLLRLDATAAEIWIDASSILAGLKVLMGVDPKKDYKDKVAKVSLS